MCACVYVCVYLLILLQIAVNMENDRIRKIVRDETFESNGIRIRNNAIEKEAFSEHLPMLD